MTKLIFREREREGEKFVKNIQLLLFTKILF